MAWLLGEWHDRLPSDSIQSYCIQNAEQERHFWLEIFGLRDKPNPYKEVWRDRCVTLANAGLLFAQCTVKQAWIQEHFRHMNVRHDIKHRNSIVVLHKYEMTPVPDSDYEDELKSQTEHLSSVCKWFPFSKDTLQ